MSQWSERQIRLTTLSAASIFNPASVATLTSSRQSTFDSLNVMDGGSVVFDYTTCIAPNCILSYERINLTITIALHVMLREIVHSNAQGARNVPASAYVDLC